MRDITLSACEKIIEANDFMTLAKQTFTQMRTQKTRSASDQNAHAEKAAESSPENKVRSKKFTPRTDPSSPSSPPSPDTPK
jgi:hypothetical protein